MTMPDAIAGEPGSGAVDYPLMPEQWVGVYKTIDDVPGDYRLDGTADEEALAARDRDAFEHFLCSLEDVSESYKDKRYRKGYREFREFVGERGRNPLCATPADVEAFVTAARNGEFSGPGYDEIKWSTVVFVYFRPIVRAFDWFVSRVDYPHVYNSVLMASIVDGSTAREAWINKIQIDNHEWYDNE